MTIEPSASTSPFSLDCRIGAVARNVRVPPLLGKRMTWINSSFTWMMFRSGWARKDAGQVRVLGIDLWRDGFEWALAQATLAHRGTDTGSHANTSRDTPVRVQWDPERDVQIAPVASQRAIQIGLRSEAIDRYIDQWIEGIEDVTPLVQQVEAAVKQGRLFDAYSLLPVERPYPLSTAMRERIEADPVTLR